MAEIPAEFKEDAELYHQELLEARRRLRRRPHGEVALMEEEVSVEELKAAIRKGVIACKINPVFVGSAYKNKGVQELLERRGRLHAVPGGHPADQGREPRDRRGRGSSGRSEGPVLFLGLQDHDRPLRGQAHLPARVLRASGRRQLRAERHEGQEGAHRPSSGDALQPARRHRRRVRWRHRRCRGPEGHHHRRHALRRTRRSSWSPWSSRIRLSTSPWSPRPRPSRTRWPSRCRSSPRS